MNSLKNNMANCITCVRIICGIALVFCVPLGVPFYTIYITAGLSDMMDGFVARKTGSESESGARLDTIADFIFMAACFVKLIPVLEFDRCVYIWIAIIGVIKVINIIYGFVVYKKMISVHSISNKIAGVILFAFPLLLHWSELEYLALVICGVATIAAIQEGYYCWIKRFEV